MNIQTLLRNVRKARTWCPAWVDRFKYLFWLYNKWPGLLRRGSIQIRFALSQPVRELTLNVRCNRGSDSFIFSEIFDHRYYDFALPANPNTILDLGANIGFASLFFARKYPNVQIACVEPMPENVLLLRANLRDNQIAATVLPKAISINDQPLVMQRAENDYGHKVQAIPYGKALNGETLKVEGISVPSLLRELGWERIGLLKVDVEGYEGVLLSSNCEWLRCVDSLCIECHEGFGDNDLQVIAKAYGFQPPQKLAGTCLLLRD